MLSKSNVTQQIANYKPSCQCIYSALVLVKRCSLLGLSFTLQGCYNSVTTSRFSTIRMWVAYGHIFSVPSNQNIIHFSNKNI
jgi:hypothetical protein